MTGHDVVDLAKKFEDYGVEAIIYTDIGRDGMLTGVNVDATVKLARELKIPVIASGGIASIDDILHLVPVREGRHHRRDRRPRALRGQARLQGRDEGGEGQLTGRVAAQGRGAAGTGGRLSHEARRRPSPPRRQISHASSWDSPSASFPASTSPRAASSRASTSSTCAMPAIRSRSRGATTREGADELAFLDIRASIETRGLLYDMIEAVADVVFIPLTVGGGVNSIDDIRALLNAGADKVSINTAGVAQSGAVRRGRRALRRAVHRRGDRREAVGARVVARLHARRPHADRARCRRLGARGRRSRRRRNPAHQHGSRRRALRLRSRADAGRRRRGRRPGDRVGRRGIARAISSTASSRAAPTPCSPRRSSITASSRSGRRRPRWRRRESKCASAAGARAPDFGDRP